MAEETCSVLSVCLEGVSRYYSCTSLSDREQAENAHAFGTTGVLSALKRISNFGDDCLDDICGTKGRSKTHIW